MRNDSNLSLSLSFIRSNPFLFPWPQNALTNHEIFICLILSVTVLLGGWPEANTHFCIRVQTLSGFALNISKSGNILHPANGNYTPRATKDLEQSRCLRSPRSFVKENEDCVWIHRLRLGLEEHFRPATCIHWAFSLRKRPHLGFCARFGHGNHSRQRFACFIFRVEGLTRVQMVH